jgi:hypothetical protein
MGRYAQYGTREARATAGARLAVDVDLIVAKAPARSLPCARAGLDGLTDGKHSEKLLEFGLNHK